MTETTTTADMLYDQRDRRFRSLIQPSARLDRLATGFRWAEGPVWFPALQTLLFSDIPNHRMMRWTPDGQIGVFREMSDYANGNTRDPQGRLVTCQHGTRSVVRTEPDGRRTTLADAYDGRRLNSPNDVVVKSDGTIWFSDPHYGIMSDYEGFAAPQENPCVVYRADPATGALEVMIDDMQCPNGLAFSPDESLLYVADTGRMHSDDPRHIRVYRIGDGARPRDGRVFHSIAPGCADGIRVDSDGNLWSSAADGVHCIAPDGHLMGRIKVPELVSNLCFGGRAKHELYITATTSLYRVTLNRRGVQWP